MKNDVCVSNFFRPGAREHIEELEALWYKRKKIPRRQVDGNCPGDALVHSATSLYGLETVPKWNNFLPVKGRCVKSVACCH